MEDFDDTPTMSSEDELALTPLIAHTLIHSDSRDAICVVFTVADILVKQHCAVECCDDESASASKYNVSCDTVDPGRLDWYWVALLPWTKIELANELISVQVPEENTSVERCG